MKMTNLKRKEILRAIQKGLEAQFESYHYEDLYRDCGLTKKEIQWAIENVGIRAILPTEEREIKEKLIFTLKTCREDAEWALSGKWDKSDEGFQDAISNIDHALEGLE